MTRTLTFAVLLAALAVLVLTNPSRDDFARFYADRASAEVARELGVSGTLGDVIGGAAQSLLETALRDSVDRRSWWRVAEVPFPDGPVDAGLYATGAIDRTIYHGAFPEGTRTRFADLSLWEHEA